MRFYLLIFIGYLSSLRSHTSAKCIQQRLNLGLEVYCTGIPSKIESETIGNAISHQTIICATSDEPVELSKEWINHLGQLIYFYLSNCTVIKFPRNYFQNLVKLEQVILDKLGVSILEEELFHNSSNLIELSLSRLDHLEDIHPRFIGHQNRLETLSLIESKINPIQLRQILLIVYNTIKNLYWRNNKQKISFSDQYFEPFNFDNLILENNQIENFNFLKYTSTKTLSLKGNPIGKGKHLDWKNYLYLTNSLIDLDLSDTQIDTILFDNSYRDLKFPHLTKLILKDNIIENFPKNIEKILPSLLRIDIRNNRLTTLPSLFYMLKIKFGTVMLDGNTFQCNCEIKWATMFSSKQVKNLYCQATDQNNTIRRTSISQINSQTDMLCTPPNLYLEIYDQFKHFDYSLTPINDTLKIYTIDLYPGEVSNWRCIGEGNPAPKLKWKKNQKTLKSMEASSNRHKLKTTLQNLVVTYKDVEKSKNGETFICSGVNIAGNVEVHLHVSKLTEKRKSKIPIALEKTSLGRDILEQNLNLTVIALFFYWFL